MTKSELWADPEWCQQHWGRRKGRPWTEAEINKAISMRFYRATDEEIASELGRSVRSVIGKIGYWKRAA